MENLYRFIASQIIYQHYFTCAIVCKSNADRILCLKDFMLVWNEIPSWLKPKISRQIQRELLFENGSVLRIVLTERELKCMTNDLTIDFETETYKVHTW